MRKHILILMVLLTSLALFSGDFGTESSKYLRFPVNIQTTIHENGTVSTVGKYGDTFQALKAFMVSYQVTRDESIKQEMELLFDFLLKASEELSFLTPLHRSVADIILSYDDYCSDPKMIEAVSEYCSNLEKSYDSNSEGWTTEGKIENKAINATVLMKYADYCRSKSMFEKADKAEEMARKILDRLVELQLDKAEAIERANEMWTGMWPYYIRDEMYPGSDKHDPWWLGICQQSVLRALVNGYVHFNDEAYYRVAAAGARLMIDFRDGGEAHFSGAFNIADLSPNEVGWAAYTYKQLIDSGISMPDEETWIARYWKDKPPEELFTPEGFSNYLHKRMEWCWDFVETTQLPLDWDKVQGEEVFPSNGEEFQRQGGWYDGSGRPTMRVWYNAMTLAPYVMSGGPKAEEVIRKALPWFRRLIVWDRVKNVKITLKDTKGTLLENVEMTIDIPNTKVNVASGIVSLLLLEGPHTLKFAKEDYTPTGVYIYVPESEEIEVEVVIKTLIESGIKSTVTAPDGAVCIIDKVNPTPVSWPGGRGPNELILYTSDYGASTNTNPYGVEVIINDNWYVLEIQEHVGNAKIPPMGYVLSGHGTAAGWLLEHLHVGDKVKVTIVGE
ncbi:hypothetical protein [Kosmotoga olearia]|uniref:Uncharacterized protein n=1 Tax=Kosmotoga olearia (strain ATCC BAA-1733 / DSM 21960 / TBF 19.5.1) TaxID=521045 RepID=C5CFB6_KOSOT|nr:hypothetical protein [Kosmotoga olearia]ACR79394.1 hypothetical protein Kole_0678 [Kosmotoga olearia TBF 19.5.1]